MDLTDLHRDVMDIMGKYNEIDEKTLHLMPNLEKDNFINWKQVYNDDIGDVLYEHTQIVEVFGIKFCIKYYKPYKLVNNYNFIDLFGFNESLSNYTNSRVVQVFQKYKGPPIILSNYFIEFKKDKEYLKKLFMIFVYGGYIDSYTGLIEINQLFKERLDFSLDNLFDIFDNPGK
jgi:hypothetical protein